MARICCCRHYISFSSKAPSHQTDSWHESWLSASITDSFTSSVYPCLYWQSYSFVRVMSQSPLWWKDACVNRVSFFFFVFPSNVSFRSWVEKKPSKRPGNSLEKDKAGPHLVVKLSLQPPNLSGGCSSWSSEDSSEDALEVGSTDAQQNLASQSTGQLFFLPCSCGLNCHLT